MKKDLLMVGLISILLFFIITGGSIINPQHIDWLILGKKQISDNESYLIGWLFFKQAPLLQYPFLLLPKLGEGLLLTLVYTDSIPLMAIPFKIFRDFIPFDFQYFGFWIFSCFLLQGIFSYLILSRFIKNRVPTILATTLFLIAPVFLFRFQLGHFALLGHWIILASILLYCCRTFSMRKWLLVIIVSLLIHPYIFTMVAVLFGSDILQRLLKKENSLKIIVNSLISIPIIILSLFVFGHIGTTDVSSLELFGGYGHFKMNLLSIIDPEYDLLGNEISWSKVLPDQDNQHWSNTFADYEGFNYLGIGLIILLLFVLAKSLSLNIVKLFIDKKSFFLPLTLVSFMFFFFAISNNITIGEHLYFRYEIEGEMLFLVNVFRASGRFFWPVYYLIYLLIIILFIRNYTPKQVTIILSVIILFQLYDTSQAFIDINNRLNNKDMVKKKWSMDLQDDFWSTLPKRYKRIVYVFPHTQPNNSFDLLYYAAKNDLSTNFGYWFKDTRTFYNSEKERLTKLIQENNYDKFSIYYIEDEKIWENVLKNKKPSDLARKINGYNILAPNYYPES